MHLRVVCVLKAGKECYKFEVVSKLAVESDRRMREKLRKSKTVCLSKKIVIEIVRCEP